MLPSRDSGCKGTVKIKDKKIFLFKKTDFFVETSKISWMICNFAL